MKKKLYRFLRRFWPYLAIVLLTTVIEWPQLSSGRVVIGADTLFHYNRFYDTAMQIAHHNIQYWISMYGFHNSGRIVNAIYSPVLAYVMGGVLLLCRTFYRFQILTDYLIPLLAAMCLQTGLKLAKLNTKRNKVLIVFYPFTYQVFHWNVSSNFTSVGAIVLPLIVGCLIYVLRNRNYTNNPVVFGGLMGLVIQLHLITALQAIVLCILILVPAFAESKVKGRFISDVLKSIAITVALSFNILGGLLELFTGNHVAPLYALNFGNNRSFIYTQGSDGQFINTVMLVIVAMIFIMSFRYVNKPTRYIGFLSIVFFFLSSKILPWRSMMKASPVFGIFQYPSRFLVPAIVLSCFFLAMIFYDNLMMPWFRKTIAGVIGLCLLFSVISNLKTTSWLTKQTIFSNTVFPYSKVTSAEQMNKSRIINNFRKPNLTKAINSCYQGTPDYMPLVHGYTWKQAMSLNWRHSPSSQAYVSNIHNIYHNHQRATFHRRVVGHHVQFKIDNLSSDIQKLTVPAVAYQDSQVSVKGSDINGHCDRFVNFPQAEFQPGKTTVDVSYQANPADNIMVIIGLSAWCIMLLVIAGSYLEMGSYLYKRDHYQ